MAAQRTAVPLPSLTLAHQQQLQQLIATLAAQGAPHDDLAFLRNLWADMPHFRAGLPAETRSALDEIDRSLATFTGAIQALSAAIATLHPAFGPGDAPGACLLDVAHIAELAQQAHELSQFAAEAALRGQHLTDQLKRYTDQHAR